MLGDAKQEVPDFLAGLAGNKANDFDRGTDDIQSNKHYRAPNASFEKGTII